MEVVAGGVEVAKPAAAATAGERAAKRRRVAPETGARRAGGGVARRGSGRRRVQADADAAAVQRLFQACRDVFRGPGTVPRPGEVRQLRAMLGAFHQHVLPFTLLLLLLSLHSSARLCKSKAMSSYFRVQKKKSFTKVPEF